MSEAASASNRSIPRPIRKYREWARVVNPATEAGRASCTGRLCISLPLKRGDGLGASGRPGRAGASLTHPSCSRCRGRLPEVCAIVHGEPARLGKPARRGDGGDTIVECPAGEQVAVRRMQPKQLHMAVRRYPKLLLEDLLERALLDAKLLADRGNAQRGGEAVANDRLEATEQPHPLGKARAGTESGGAVGGRAELPQACQQRLLVAPHGGW